MMSPGYKGCSFAFEELYADYYGWLSRWLIYRVGCSEQAADLAQDTFIRVLRRNEAINIREPRAYLITIAKGLIANAYRRQDVERTFLSALQVIPKSVFPSEEEKYQSLETLLGIERCLQQLDEPVRQAFFLFQLDGLSQNEIATRLNISLSTVKRYISKALLLCVFNEGV
ncbi:sigma-70 family RNA polymerase sigma factor [Oceanimonas baumannii]|uniref:sigma-70 family RNA polymerase sigma factor n=1 Tax=Oceanimonas baumannii TaxID=129578 RepID=UPI003A921B9F